MFSSVHSFFKMYSLRLHWVFAAARGLPLVGASSFHLHPLVLGHRLLLARCGGFFCCRAQAPGCLGFCSCSAFRLSRPSVRGIFHSRDRTHVSWIGRQILNHWTTREVQFCLFSTPYRSHISRAFWLAMAARKCKHLLKSTVNPSHMKWCLFFENDHYPPQRVLNVWILIADVSGWTWTLESMLYIFWKK